MKYLLLSLALFSTNLFAQEASLEAKQRFCHDRLDTKTGLQKLIASTNNQIFFHNQGGLFQGGVCWWHSRFIRAAAYLAVFDPSLQRPSESEGKKIVQAIRDRKGIVTVPGYANLYQFSVEYGQDILNKLGDWQRADALFKVAWVKGLSGNPKVAQDDLAKKMDDLYTRVSNGEVVYQMLQMPGVVAHAWLVVGMTRSINGYILRILDSNIPGEVMSYTYNVGDEKFLYQLEYWEQSIPFVPYTGQTDEEVSLRKKLTKYCEDV